MPDVALPIVKTFTIPSLGWSVVDIRNLDSRQHSQTMQKWSKSVVDVTKAWVRKEEFLCEYTAPKQINEFEVGFSSAWMQDNSLTRDEYAKDHPRKRERFQDQGVTHGATFGALVDGRVIGGFHCSNISIETDTPRKLTIRAMLWVGVDPVRGRAEMDVWMDAISYIIDTDLELEDGRVLDFIGYDFISDIPREQWPPERAVLIDLTDRLGAAFDTQGGHDAKGDRQYRRRGAGRA